MHYLLRKIKKHLSKHTVYKYYYNKYSKYEYLSEKYKNLHVYESLLEKSTISEDYKTPKLISFHKHLKFNDTKIRVKKKLGNPAYQITNTENKDIDIYFYKIQIGKQKIRCEVHFHKNVLFLFKYHLPYLKNIESKMMFSFLYDKYGVNKHQPFPDKIKDISDKVLIVSRHIGVSLSYINPANHFFDILKFNLNQKKLHKEQRDVQLKRFYSSL